MSTHSPEMLALGMIWYIVFLFSTTCHEAAHALAAKLGGDPTAFRGGQLTLNPMPHIQREPFGLVLIPLVSFVYAGWMIGWASAPYDPVWQRRYPRRAAWMALAGPGANFTLMLVAAAMIRAGIAAGVFRAPERITFTRVTEAVDPAAWGFMATLVSVFFLLNLLLGIFNLLPVPPLDGHTGVTLLMRERLAFRFLDATNDPTFRLMGIFIAWLTFDRVFHPIFSFALNLLYPGAHYG